VQGDLCHKFIGESDIENYENPLRINRVTAISSDFHQLHYLINSVCKVNSFSLTMLVIN